jgi:hypothetical protein
MPLSPSEQVAVISEERGQLRQEVVELEKLVSSSGFAFFTGLATFFGVYFSSGRLVSDPVVRGWVLFLLSQFEIFCGLLLIILLSNVSIHSGYIAALERKITRLHGTPLAVWESEIVPRFISSPSSALFWLSAFIYAFAIGVLLALVLLTMKQIRSTWPGILSLIEVCVVSVLGVRGSRAARGVRDLADKKLSDGGGENEA